jgi:hypothetical protein
MSYHVKGGLAGCAWYYGGNGQRVYVSDPQYSGPCSDAELQARTGQTLSQIDSNVAAYRSQHDAAAQAAASGQNLSTVAPAGSSSAPTVGVLPSSTVAAVQAAAQRSAASLRQNSVGITDWLSGSMLLGLPNWMLVAGGAAALFAFSGGGHRGHR